MLLSNESKKRYTAFWEGDAYERCCMYLTVYAGGTGRPEPANLAQQWEDAEFRARQALWDTEHRLYFADAFPHTFVNMGPGSLAAMIGGTYRWAERTVWFENEPVITDWANPPAPVLNRDSAMYRMEDALTQAMLAAGKDKFYTSIADFGGTYDILAALRGTQTLLMDLYDEPDAVKAYAKQVGAIWTAYFFQSAERVLRVQDGVTTWMPVWSDLPYYPLQCDFSAMISPDMFEEFILPDLQLQSECIDRCIYHLDGPGELPHLPHLLSIPRLSAIQWSPGDGREGAGSERWFGLYDEIQAAGKGLVIIGVSADELEPLLRHISTKGVFIACGAKDETTAREMVAIAEGYGVK